MNTLNFLDANLWLALMWRRHAHASRALQWFENAADEQFFFCRFTQLATLRLLTTEHILGADTHTMVSAWRMWDMVTADSRMKFVAEPEFVENGFRLLSRLPSRSPKVWADAYLLAFAASAGLKLVTFDRALEDRGADVLVL